jgi:hypothetical protein
MEAVDVDDRNEHDAAPIEDGLDPGIAVVAVQQYVGEDHRVLAGRPLPSVVDTIDVRRRTTVVRSYVGCDLDAEDVTVLQALAGQLHQARLVRVRRGQSGHLVVVVGERPVIGHVAGDIVHRREVDRGLLQSRIVTGQILDGDLVVHAELVEPCSVARPQQELRASIGPCVGVVEVRQRRRLGCGCRLGHRDL